ncbi:glycoside hydrolase family 18 protein [Halalkalibacter hemicellulosilyticus]|uniref:Spore cortex-lytic enzyme n=1 Tax=Halalkalibacter hemicellulosilyticusJCM 9152 TaxID=1236971 RepID=W4QEW1_9BACI|nr:glycoside hydrolase family 18 protein [Halalkalibacter hemicellulosilyticus]GAE30606.1 spore cortex-lytic enzyme [Halalkalibacter hemicellulosilyticusJCM 9152]
MQIYVIQQGDSLWNIAQAYESSVTDIVEANQIPDPNQLVIGQSIVIPIVGQFYWVQLGDSLWSISRQFGLDYMFLADINELSIQQPLQVGMRLYIPELTKREIESNAYIEPIGETVSEELLISARNVGRFLTYLAPFSYEARRDGSLDPQPLNGIPEIAEETGASLMMVITNLEDGQFSGELAVDILQSEEVQDRLLDTIIEEALRVGYKDIHFDFEFLPGDQREAYNQFLRKAAERIRANGLLISTALAPKTRADQPGQWYEAHDYRAHGEIVDFVVLMTYEWGYSGGPPMAVSPIGPVEEVVQYALTEMPANKIMLGQNLYGYDWTLPFVPGGDYAEAISPQEAIQRAQRYQVAIQFDEDAQAPFYFYTDEEGSEHEVWFEDARSIQAKFDLIKRLQLRGISYWKLGLAFPQNWLLLADRFQIVKR